MLINKQIPCILHYIISPHPSRLRFPVASHPINEAGGNWEYEYKCKCCQQLHLAVTPRQMYGALNSLLSRDAIRENQGIRLRKYYFLTFSFRTSVYDLSLQGCYAPSTGKTKVIPLQAWTSP